MSISLFDKRALMEVSEELLAPSTFLTSTFFKEQEQFAAATVDLDLYVGKRRTAAYVLRHQEGPNVEKIGYKTLTFNPPVLRPKINITGADLQKRVPGGVIYTNERSLNPAAQDYVLRQINEANSMIERNEELQSRDALFDGAVKFYNENADLIMTIDYGRDDSLIQTITTKWDDSAADILADCREYRRKVQQLSGFVPRIVILGADAADVFLNDALVKASLNVDYADRGRLAYDLRDSGGIYLGTADGFDFWTYDEYVINPATGQEGLLVPAKKALIASTAPATRVYGSVEVGTDDGIIVEATPRYVDVYGLKDPASVVVQVHSTPLMVTNHPNAYATLTVLT